jgi:hypothetical protein
LHTPTFNFPLSFRAQQDHPQNAGDPVESRNLLLRSRVGQLSPEPPVPLPALSLTPGFNCDNLLQDTLSVR